MPPDQSIGRGDREIRLGEIILIDYDSFLRMPKPDRVRIWLSKPQRV